MYVVIRGRHFRSLLRVSVSQDSYLRPFHPLAQKICWKVVVVVDQLLYREMPKLGRVESLHFQSECYSMSQKLSLKLSYKHYTSMYSDPELQQAWCKLSENMRCRQCILVGPSWRPYTKCRGSRSDFPPWIQRAERRKLQTDLPVLLPGLQVEEERCSVMTT